MEFFGLVKQRIVIKKKTMITKNINISNSDERG